MTGNVSAQSGVLFFPVLARLKTKPNGHDFCVADYSSDRIVFHVENRPAEVVALVSSFHPSCIYSVLTTTLSLSSFVSVPLRNLTLLY